MVGFCLTIFSFVPTVSRPVIDTLAGPIPVASNVPSFNRER